MTNIVLGTDITQVDASGAPKFVLGSTSMIITSAGQKTYKYVKYDTGAGPVAAVSGQVAYYYLLDGYKSSTVTSDLSDATGEIGAGVLQSAPTDGQYCWIQIRGFATLALALTAGADGDPLTPTGSTDGTLDVNVATAANTNVCAIAGDISDKEILCMFVE